METKIFRDRTEAGQLLAQKLSQLANRNDVLVLALPRGGVPVAYEIAKALHTPLDVFLVRKIGVPWQPELALGAIASGDVTVFNDSLIKELGISAATIDELIAREKLVLAERNQKYRHNRPFPQLENRTVILVDDGIATGATIRAAIKAIRHLGNVNLVVAVPVGPPGVFAQFTPLAEQVFCLETPAVFYAIGNWYESFPQVDDSEVIQLLEDSNADFT